MSGAAAESPAGHHFVFEQRRGEPAGATVRTYRPDIDRLFLYWAALALVTGAVVTGLGFSKTKNEKGPPNPDQLANAVAHVAYEWVAFNRASRAIEERPDRLVLEAALLHARNLRNFFVDEWRPDRRHADKEVLAELYFDSPSAWRNTRSRLATGALGGTRKAINAQLTHISIERVRPQITRDLESDLPQIGKELEEHWKLLMRSLDQTKRERFQVAVQEAEDEF